MSFSSDIKDKLSKIETECEFCKLAELYGIMKFASSSKNDVITVITEHKGSAERIIKLFEECIGFIPVSKDYAGGYRLEIDDDIQCDMVEEKLHLGENLENFFDELIPFECCRKSYIRGAFLGGGSISDPKKNYHMEFDAKGKSDADSLIKVLELEGINARSTVRKNQCIVYLKGYEEIAGLLGLMGAGKASMEIYNVSIEKEIRNSVNRRMNCESANMDKVVKAYGKHILAIDKICATIGLDSLPETLREIAIVRIEYPDETLKELGERLEKPIGKSGVNHRLNRIIEIADSI